MVLCSLAAALLLGGQASGVDLRLYPFGPQATFEGVTAVFLAVDGPGSGDPLEGRGDGVLEVPVSDGGRVHVDFDREGLFELRVVDGLGMSLIFDDGPMFVSSVPGAALEYAVRCHPLSTVTGAVVAAGNDSPIGGATLRVDPRFRKAGTPGRAVRTGPDGRYRVRTARTQVVAVDAPGQQTINMRFAPSEEAGTIRMKPMKRERFIAVPGKALALDGTSPSPTFHPVEGITEGPLPFGVEAERALLEFALYDQAWLEWPLASGDAAGARLLQRFLVKRKSGRMKIELADTRSAGADLSPGEGLHLKSAKLVAPIDARSFLVSESAGSPCRLELPTGQEPSAQKGAQERSQGSPPSGAPYTLSCQWQDSPASLHVSKTPRPGGLPALGAIEAQLPQLSGPCTLVHDGSWLSVQKRQGSPEPAVAQLPGAGEGIVYASSAAVRGDVDASPVAADKLASLDLKITSSGRSAQGIALRLVPVGCSASDEILDLLGETSIVSDADGTVALRGFAPAEYKLRIDPARSGAAFQNVKLDRAVLRLAGGLNDSVELKVQR